MSLPPSSGRLAAALQPHLDSGALAGAVVLVADRNRVLALEAVGYADVATRKPMTPDSFFWVASMTKPITGAAFMMLVEQGLVGLDDPVEKYIPGFASLRVLQADGAFVPPVHPPTIRETLSHTSGLRFLNTKDAGIIDVVPLKTSIEHNLLEPLLAQPGTTYLYSNEGIDTAGRIIELLTGLSYEAFLQERLFTPLGMTDTTFFPAAEQLRRLATTYRAKEDKTGIEQAPFPYLTAPFDGPGRYAAPGGGLFGTAIDMARFCQMLLNGGTFEGKTYLRPESIRQMTTKQTGPLVPNDYGLGIGASPDGKTFGHGGALKTSMNVDHEQIRVFLVQQQGDWLTGNPVEDFDAAARRFYPGAGAAPAAAVEGAVIRR